MSTELVEDYTKYKEKSGKLVEGYDKDIRIFFTNLPSSDIGYLSQVTTNVIISTLEEYIRKSNLTSKETAFRYKSSIKDFLNYLIGEEKIKNDILLKEFGYTPSNDKSYIGKMNKYIADNPLLKEKKDYIALSEDEIEQLIIDCNKTISDEENLRKATKSSKYYNKILSALIIKLIIFTGLSYRCLREILYYNTLNLIYNTIKINNFTIHLPHGLLDQFKIYEDLLFKINNNSENRDYLFIKFNSNQLSTITSSSSLSNYIKAYTGRQDINGIIRRTIINMILHGINESLIKKLTGIKSTIYEPCQKEANKMFSAKSSVFLDSKLRSIYTFDLL